MTPAVIGSTLECRLMPLRQTQLRTRIQNQLMTRLHRSATLSRLMVVQHCLSGRRRSVHHRTILRQSQFILIITPI